MTYKIFNGKTSAAGIYLFKFNNGSIGTMCEIYSKLTKDTETTSMASFHSAVFINFDRIPCIDLVFTLLILNK